MPTRVEFEAQLNSTATDRNASLQIDFSIGLPSAEAIPQPG